MQVVILCGGLGTRLSEETALRPKPMVPVGDKPLLWHIMNIYGHYNFKNFVVALGYKGDVIKDYFLHYSARHCNLEIDINTGEVIYDRSSRPDWKVKLIDTGEKTMTGGRLLRLKEHLKNETFMLTYGDGVTDVNLDEVYRFHKSHGKLVTVTAVRPMARFGGIMMNGNLVKSFTEKPEFGEGWINGGFFVMEPGVFEYLSDDSTVLERSPMENLVRDEQLVAYQHPGFWQCMDTIRDRESLEHHWAHNPPWKVWS
jgi:glucose-1-phosphate cytidylyltransferase